MLKKIRICNFKCYGPQGADFNLSRVNFIFGDNSSGKSTFLQFLKMMINNTALKGEYKTQDFDDLTFKNQDKEKGVKARIIIGGKDANGDIPNGKWFFVKKDGKYLLQDEKGQPINKSQLAEAIAILKSETLIEHLEASRPDQDAKKKFSSSFSLLADALEEEKKREKANDILKRLGLDYQITKVKDKTNNHIVSDSTFDISVPLLQVGAGIHELVRIAQKLAAWENGILEIEEPETHLNEKQMAPLMNVLVEEALKRPNGQLIIECHSELMVMQLQNQTRAKNITPEDITISVVTKTPNGSETTSIGMSDKGKFTERWPDGGFFPARTKILDKYFQYS